MGEELSMREQMEDAWEQFEEEDVTPPETEASPEVVEAVSKEKEPPVEEQPEEEEKPAAEAKPDASKQESEETDPDKKTEEKAPHSWSPANREQWGKLPSEVKAQITKREAEIEKAMRNTAESRRVAQQLAQTVEPYRQSMMAAGFRDPFQAIDTLFRAEATLRSGTQAEKARQMIDLIQQYGVDIGTLDSMLTGQAPTAQPHSEIDQILEQKLAPFQQFITAQQQREQAAQQAEAAQARQVVEQFQGEFLSDVRMDMADIMDLAHKNGRAMTIQEAYDRACALHPEVSKILAQREEQKRLMGTTEAVQKKKSAANASLTGRQGGNPAPTGNESLRDVIENAWNEQVG